MRKKTTAGVAGLAAALLGLTACGGGSDASEGSDRGTELSLVGYSVLDEANKGDISGFHDTDAGKDVTF